MRVLLIFAALAGCTGAQSARVRAPGSTEVTGGIQRITVPEDGSDESLWIGEVMVRHGLADRVDGGLRVARTAGRGEIVTAAVLEPKFELTAPGAQTAVSGVLGVGLAWAEQGTDFENGTYVLSPAVVVGHQVSPTFELILAPRFTYIKPDESSEHVTSFGLALGARIGDRSSAIYPMFELQVANDSDGSSDSETIYLLGLGVGVGN